MRTDYLNRMGITQWRLRDTAVADAFFQVQLKDTAGKTVGVMIAEIDLSLSIESQEQLLRKIAEAMSVNYDCHYCESLDFPSQQYQFIICLGKKIFFDKEKSRQVICANALSELMQDASMKKTLWAEVKKLRDLFNE